MTVDCWEYRQVLMSLADGLVVTNALGRLDEGDSGTLLTAAGRPAR